MTTATTDRAAARQAATPLAARPVVCVSHGFQTNYERGFCNALAANGVDLTLISSDRTDTRGLSRGVRNVNLRGSQEESRPPWRKAANMLRYHARLLAYTLARRDAIIHVIGLIHPPLWHGLVLGLWFRTVGARYVLTVHDLVPHDRRLGRYHRAVYGWSYRLAHRLVVHTERMRQQLVERFGADPSRIAVMPHGIEPAPVGAVQDEADGVRAPSRPPLILAFGRVAPYKGIDVLLQALEAVDFAFRLRIAGVASRDDLRRRLAAAIERHPHRAMIDWRDGYVPEDEMEAMFAAADLLVLPYRHIDQSGVLFQALRHGVPVVATRVGAFELLVTEEVGELAVPGDAADLAAALSRWAARRAAFSRARIRALGRSYEWPVVARALRPVYGIDGP